MDIKTRKVESRDVEAAVLKAAGTGVQLIPLDTTYWVASEADTLALAQDTHTSAKQYVAERFDCDDFAFLFKGLMSGKEGLNSVGLVIDFSGKHAYCVAVVDTPKGVVARFIEPQRDAYVRLHTAPCYKLASGIILL